MNATRTITLTVSRGEIIAALKVAYPENIHIRAMQAEALMESTPFGVRLSYSANVTPE